MSLEELISQQVTCADLILKSLINFKKSSLKTRTKGVISTRLQDVTKFWQSYTETHYKIDRLAQNLTTEERNKHSYLFNDAYSETEEKYYEFVGLLRDALEGFIEKSSIVENEANATFSSHSSSSLLKLPRITLPTFSGSYTTWRSFHDLFVSLVHTNPSLTPVQKLHYLKSSVTGEAENLLRQFQITDANYRNAWNMLLERYNNTRVLVNAQLKTLCNQPAIPNESAKGIKTLLDKSSECIFELEALGVSTKEWDAILIYTLVQRLPSETHRMWEQEINASQDVPTFEQFKVFLQSRFRTLEAISETKPSPTINRTHQKQGRATSHFASHSNKCTLCNEMHPIYKCSKFLNYNVDTRYKVAYSNKLCTNCLSKGHTLQFCKSKFACHKCGRKHHSLLHRTNFVMNTQRQQPEHSLEKPLNHTPENKIPSNTAFVPSTSANNTEKPVKSFHSNRKQQVVQALLSTALVNIPSKTGTIYTFRALIDSGSQVSFITQAAAKKLRLPKSSISIQITGLGKSETTQINSQISLTLRPRSISKSTSTTTLNALIVKTITDILPPSIISIEDWSHIKDLELADPCFNQPGKIDLLLGADVYSQILLEGLRRGPIGTPIAQNSTLGWILFGNISSDKVKSHNTASTLTINVKPDTNISLDDLLRKFWETEEVSIKPKYSNAEIECEKFYEQTHQRNATGRYEVRLPFQNNKPPSLGESRNIALRRFYSLERKLEQNPDLYTDYRKCINEYLTLGHMKPAYPPRNQGYYLPHHAVVKDSTTTKVRVVFDASAKTTNGKSLNEQLHTGPVLQSDLFSILLKWRKYKYAMSADIEKMYRMINIQTQDQRYQYLVWRNDSSEPIQDYVLTTVTFGTTPAPYLAIKTLQQLAKDESQNYPLASKIIPTDFYVDDLITGVDTIEEGLETQRQLLGLLSSGGFNLRKWVSNTSELLMNIPEEHREVQLPLRFASDESVKALGIIWYPATDHFTLQYRQTTDRLSTKRSVLSQIATLFDPLGWISPIVVTAKILMQALWLSGCSWDDPIPTNLDLQWQNFKSELHILSEIRIPRWLQMSPQSQSCQIHGFSDASIHAYSAAVYIRVTDQNGKVHVNLLMAKSKVAPVKPITLPRLELCGAVLLSKLLKRIKTDLNMHKIPTFAWTDSTIALAWIRSPANKFKTYVANRVAEVQENSEISSWHHIRSEINPADLNSRGIRASSLIDNKLWWHGPSWLQQPEECWPKTFPPAAELSTELEIKKITHFAKIDSFTDEIISRFSSFNKLVRTIAYCRRFANNCKKLPGQRSGAHLSAKEISESKISLIKLSQNSTFHQEIKLLQKGLPIHSKSSIISLNPFLDDQGLIRLGGRLHNSHIPYSQRHPIILPHKCHLTQLIINHTHLTTLHGGVQLVLTTLRNEYWIVKGRNTVKNAIHKCIKCFKYSAQTRTQLMGNLPPSRVNISRPFQHVGVDFAGPINIKMSKHRGNRSYKGYICIFVCMATKAVHIEPVSDLTTSAFIAALRRFISRRGLCSDIYSDCGTNFVGASKIIKNEYEAAIREATQITAERVANEGIKWHFNPPSAPHFGGLWEAGVKAIKFHLKRVLGNEILTFEEFTTVLTQIEACLNSRPLCALNEDPEDCNILTPGHFLIGSSINAIPEPGKFQNISAITRWNHIQLLQQHFWKRWSTDYLNTLQNRPKWHSQQTNPKVGDLVIIKEGNLPPTTWLLGRITEVHEGTDKLVRVVTIKTNKGIIKRPITKISILPVHSDDNNPLTNS